MDFYHMQRICGNLTRNVEKLMPLTGNEPPPTIPLKVTLLAISRAFVVWCPCPPFTKGRLLSHSTADTVHFNGPQPGRPYALLLELQSFKDTIRRGGVAKEVLGQLKEQPDANLDCVFAKNTLHFDVLFHIQCNEVLLSLSQVMFKLPKFPTGTSRIMRAKSTSSMSSSYWKTLDTVATWASNTLPRGQLPKGWRASLKNSEGKKTQRFTF